MLKEMIESIINENTDQAKVEFHSYLKNKLSETKSLGSIIQSLGIKFKRKPSSWNDITPSDVEAGEFTYELEENRQDITILKMEDVYGKNNSPLDDFESKSALPTIFAIDRGNSLYIIKTEGYNYARYIARLDY